MTKKKIAGTKNVYELAQERLKVIFNEFDNIYVSFSGGKDSGVLLNMCIDYIRKNNLKVRLGVFHMDYEIQYKMTIDYVDRMLEANKDILDVYRVCIPFRVATCTSMYQSFWRPWEDSKKNIWVRSMPKKAMTKEDFPFYNTTMWDYEFQMRFAQWIHNKNDAVRTCCLIGIRSHGNVVALGERDCSVQRNHQKLIEESPSPAIDEKTRRKMNEYAVLAAKTVGYTNAGTIEFIVDPKGNFYFMEMNTRIQVEHGVTEMVTGTDLIIEQIRVAMGEELSFKQEDIRIKGHAIECRINAEIPEKNFMPSPGVVQHMHLPAGNGVRVDTALYTGYKIPSEYDSMIAKVIVHAPDREAALQKMRSALDEMVVMGVETNLDFQYQIMKNNVFCEGKADTGFIENVLKIKG